MRMYFALVMGPSSYSEESEGNRELAFLSLLSTGSSHMFPSHSSGETIIS